MTNDEAALAATAVSSSERVAKSASRGALAHLKYALLSMRPRQWTKNGIVFMAFVFSLGQSWHVGEPDTWLPLLRDSVFAFVFFCLVSSADYLLNDIRDRESDRLHPKKRFRPIAAGTLSVPAAYAWAAGLIALGVGGGFALEWKVGAILAGYLALMLAYSYWLKHVVLLDLAAIAAGFVLRAMAGAVAIDVPISPWLYVVTALGALFLIINKRRAEILLLDADAGNHRPVLEEYSADLLDQMASTVTASTLIAYGLYTFTAEGLPENHSMMLTIPFVLYGIFRYLYLVHKKDQGGSPEEVLLRDVPLIICIVLWMATAAAVLIVNRE
ncbi:MAG TPA: decaprenyl-phosphate phosphoribosyltransferase [Dehalococcoidia bacterium]|nr:decaprenyl-phosphate phosphoribosyltransferase [Dehalococcoidia bacterium]